MSLMSKKCAVNEKKCNYFRGEVRNGPVKSKPVLFVSCPIINGMPVMLLHR